MSDLEQSLERIGLSQYLDSLVDEGFDTWDTVLYITESDLDALNVRLGHRRKLQREIALARNISFESLIPQIGLSEATHGVETTSRPAGSVSGESKGPVPGPTAKRKYRRHPKADDNAPERPPSAYVLFSNAVREEVKERRLSFTEIAKIVGERWQNLAPVDKKKFETKATMAKDDFNSKLSDYKRTVEYRDYQQYLVEFKSRNSAPSTDSKRPKIEKAPSSGSTGSVSSGPAFASTGLNAPLSQSRQRTDSVSGYRYSPGGSAHSSPTPGLPKLASQSSIEGSPSSSSVATPISGTSSRPPLNNQASHQPNRLQSLPKIVHLEPSREATMPATHLPPLITDATRGPYRRTMNASHASFLRHDVSKSSMSSNISSNTSTESATYTPVTPAEEYRTVGLSPIQHDQSTGLGSNQSRPHSRAPQNYVQEPWHSQQHIEGHSPFNRLSLAEHANSGAGSHGHSRGETHPVGPGYRFEASQPPPAIYPREGQPESQEIPRTGVDPLSVLALAGHYIDRAERPKSPV